MSAEIGIVGASAAGLFTAYLLGRAGRKVRVFEGAQDFDPKPRTLIVTSRMDTVLGEIGRKAQVNEIRRFELFTDGRVARISLDRPDLVIERNRLIRELAYAAQASGAHIEFGRQFVSLQGGKKSLTLHLRGANRISEEATVSTAVGADGAFSRVARSAGWPQQSTVPLVQATVRLPSDMPADTTRVWFIPDDTPYFYWLIPDSPTTGVAGLIGQDGPATRRALEGFLAKRHLEPTDYQAARIPVYSKWIPIRRKLDGGEVYLVGDAAGHVKVTTVGGIVTGFRGAMGVADAILAGKPGSRLRALRRELDVHLLIRKVIHNSNQARYSHLVDLLNARSRKDLEGCTRDEPSQILWRLCLHQPRLLLFGLRALLSGGSLRGSAHSH